MPRGILLTSNLPQLQNLIKRDPSGYKEEFLQQWNHYNSIRQIFQSNPDEQAKHFRELISFIAQVAPCYPRETKDFPAQLSSLLLESHAALAPDLRKNLVQNLVMLRNKGVITSIELLRTLFPLLPRTTSSTLRSSIRSTILSDIRNANTPHKNHKLNRAVQTMLFGMVEKGMEGEVAGDKGKAKAVKPANDGLGNNGDEAMWAVVLTAELWKKGIWNDANSVSIIALGCFHPIVKVQSASIHFFLGSEDEDEEDSDEDDIPDPKSLQHRREINKKTRSGDKKLIKTMKQIKKKKHAKSNITTANFPALQILNDPQTFGEKLYDSLSKHDKRFSLSHKLLLMQLLSRVMGAHKLCVLPFYTYVLKYLTHHQLQITAILAALAQSVHDLTPPDALEPVVRKLAAEFVHPGVGSEVVAAGLNAVREVCRRQPWAMEEDLLGDLVEYRKSREKGVVVAARGLLQLYREVNPGMLKRRERGKEAAKAVMSGTQPLPFGHSLRPAEDVEDLVLLEDHLRALRGAEGESGDESEADENDWKGWDVEEDSSEESSESEGWVDVESDGEEGFEVSDSEDEKEKERKVDKDTKEHEPAKDAEPNRVSSLATTKILTPADFALLNDLRRQAAASAVDSGTGGKAAKRKLALLEKSKTTLSTSQQGNLDTTAFISELDILGPRKKAKADYAERIASIEKGREGREKYGSSKGKKRKEVGSSTTNREKARNKPVMMILGSGKVKGKKKASLREKQMKLRKHIEKGKKAHH